MGPLLRATSPFHRRSCCCYFLWLHRSRGSDEDGGKQRSGGGGQSIHCPTTTTTTTTTMAAHDGAVHFLHPANKRRVPAPITITTRTFRENKHTHRTKNVRGAAVGGRHGSVCTLLR
jgi:hypothetical protein